MIKDIQSFFQKHKTDATVGIITGFVLYGFMLTNKIPNHDDLTAMFDVGATITSGRWGLWLIKKLVVNCLSIPWLNGLCSIALLALGASVTTEIFDITDTRFKSLLSASIVSFPSFIGMMTYMFTAPAFSLAFLFAVFSVYLFTKSDSKIHTVIGGILLVLSIGIYQPFLGVAAAYLLVNIIDRLFDSQQKIEDIVRRGVTFLLLLGLSVALYWGIVKLSLKLTGSGFSEYASEKIAFSDFFYNIPLTYARFGGILLIRLYDIISSDLSRVVHIIAFAITGIEMIFIWLKGAGMDTMRRALIALGILLFPLASCCMTLLFSSGFHTIVFVGMISIYSLMIVFLKHIEASSAVHSFARTLAKCAVATVLLTAIISNIYIGNKAYFRMYMNKENATAFYSTMIAQIQNIPEYNEDSVIAIIGKTPNNEALDRIEETEIIGTSEDIRNAYSRNNFMRLYLGFNPNRFASEEDIRNIINTKEYKNMAVYPYYGSIKNINGIITVKLSEMQ